MNSKSETASDPEVPWLARDEWAKRRMTYRHVRAGLGLLSVALLWNAAMVAAAYFVLPRDHPFVVKASVFLLLLIGPFLLWGAVRATMKAAKFPITTLLLDKLPHKVGERFSGRLEWPIVPGGDILVSMNCAVSLSAESENVVWRDERRFSTAALLLREGVASLPVSFDLPPGLPQTGGASGQDCVWRLTAQMGGSKDGPDVAAHFEIPVFGHR